MIISELLNRFFQWDKPSSRVEAKNRLKLVIAHDRAGLSPEMLESMRREIIEVLARYVEIDSDSMEFSLENNQRMTSLVANLPIRRIISPGSENIAVKSFLKEDEDEDENSNDNLEKTKPNKQKQEQTEEKETISTAKVSQKETETKKKKTQQSSETQNVSENPWDD